MGLGLGGACDFVAVFGLVRVTVSTGARGCAIVAFEDGLALVGAAGLTGAGTSALAIGLDCAGLGLEVLVLAAFPAGGLGDFGAMDWAGLLRAAWAAPNDFDGEVAGCTGVFLGALAMSTVLSEQVSDTRTPCGRFGVRIVDRGSWARLNPASRRARLLDDSPRVASDPSDHGVEALASTTKSSQASRSRNADDP